MGVAIEIQRAFYCARPPLPDIVIVSPEMVDEILSSVNSEVADRIFQFRKFLNMDLVIADVTKFTLARKVE